MPMVPIVAALSAVALFAGCANDPGPVPVPTPAKSDVLQAEIDRLVDAGAAGALATFTDGGRTVVRTSGVADLETRAPIPAEPPQRVRVGSITKSFTSAIVLQLVGEGRIRLDEPIETYLPGLLRGEGIDGRAITVRQILRHQSGLPELTEDERIDEYRAALANQTMTPEQEMAIALSHPAMFPPGARYQYSNTNYIVAGMLVEGVTGASYTAELQRRILAPLGLHDTYLPAPGDREVQGPHPKGYAALDGTVTDVTRIEPSVPWAAGALVSTGADLNRFFGALLAGQVVPEAQLREMRDGVPIEEGADLVYGLGLGSGRLPCGGEFVGHTGGIYGFTTLSFAATTGRAVTFSFTKAPDTKLDPVAVLSRVLCP